MAKQSRSIAVLICALVAVVLTFVAPLVVQVVETPFKTFTKDISLFGGFDCPWVTVLLVVFGSGLIVSAAGCLFTDGSRKLVSMTRVFSILFLLSQILAVIIAMYGFYDDTSILGSIKSSIGGMLPSLESVFAILISLVTVILSFLL